MSFRKFIIEDNKKLTPKEVNMEAGGRLAVLRYFTQTRQYGTAQYKKRDKSVSFPK